jgi:hypothetical protein
MKKSLCKPEAARRNYTNHSKICVADLRDDFERETAGFTFKIIPLLSNAQKSVLVCAYRAVNNLGLPWTFNFPLFLKDESAR